jgi:heterotetrameric sarcosine oxidase gamma subunit
VADLIATSAEGRTLAEADGLSLSQAPLTPIWAIAPYRGKAGPTSEALAQAHGLPVPAPGALHEAEGARIAWSGLDQAFLLGVRPNAALADHAALTDQSDAWANLVLDGARARDVLARLVPIDLSPAACPPGSAPRTLMGHMPALILHPGGDRFEILVFRSMTGTAAHDLTRAMRALSARAAL